MKKLLFWLKVSRPGLWFQTIWLYLLPTSKDPAIFHRSDFWIGFIFVTFPLNLMVYGWNDFYDTELDKFNIRKGNFLFGAKSSRQELKNVFYIIFLIQAPFWLFFVSAKGWLIFLIFSLMVVVNLTYNHPGINLKGTPPFELINQAGYLLILPFSIVLNATKTLPMTSVLYLFLFCTHSHLMGEVMDIMPDKAAGRRTTAILLGAIKTKILIIFLVLAESLLLVLIFEEIMLGGFLFISTIWLALDAFVLYRDNVYTRKEYYLLGYLINFMGYASITYVWLKGTFAG